MRAQVTEINRSKIFLEFFFKVLKQLNNFYVYVISLPPSFPDIVSFVCFIEKFNMKPKSSHLFINIFKFSICCLLPGLSPIL